MTEMTKTRVAGRRPRYHFSGSVTDATSEPLLVPSEGQGVVVGVVPGTGATVEVSISTPAEVAAGTATWFPWASGEVVAKTIDFVDFNVTALRLVSTGASSWEVSA